MKDENSVLKTDTPSTADDSQETNDENSPVNFIKIVDSCGLVLDIPAVATSDELIVDDSEQSNAQTNNEIPQPSASTKMTKVYRKKSTGSLKSSFLDSLSNRVQEVTRRRKAIDFRNLPPGECFYSVICYHSGCPKMTRIGSVIEKLANLLGLT